MQLEREIGVNAGRGIGRSIALAYLVIRAIGRKELYQERGIQRATAYERLHT